MRIGRATFVSLDRLTQGAAFAGFIGLIGVAAATVFEILMRWVDVSVEGVDDLSRVGFAVIIASSFPAVLWHSHNITIRFLGNALGRRPSAWLDVFGALLTLGFFILFAWQLVVLTADLKQSNDATMIIRAPTWPWWTVATIFVAICVPVQLLVLRDKLALAIRGGEPPPEDPIEAPGF